jgi:predicted CXXCH cytochrome family protein
MQLIGMNLDKSWKCRYKNSCISNLYYIFLNQEAKKNITINNYPIPYMRVVLRTLLLFLAGAFFYAADYTLPALHAAEFVIVYSNDVLGELELCGCDEEQLGGLPRKASVINTLKQQGRQVLMVDAGNLFFKDKPGSAIEHNEFALKSEYILDAYKKIGCDALNVGEADLLLGIKQLKALQQKAPFPFLSVNLVNKKTKEPLFKPYIIKEIAGSKVGIIGLYSAQGSVEPPLVVMDPVKSTQGIIEKIRAQCNFLVALSNLGLEGDKQLAQKVPDIDLIIGGRSTTKMPEPVKQGKTSIVQAYKRGQYIGKLEVNITTAQTGPRIALRNYLIPLGETIADDKGIAAIAKEYKARVIAMNRQEFFREKLNNKKSPQNGESLYAGVEKCGSCHQPQYDNWQNTPHANAYETVMKNCNNFDIECLPCHTTGFKEPGGFTVSQGDESPFINVQCEVCHGPGKKHVGKGDIVRDPGESLCRQCHDEKNSPRFNYGDFLPIVKCPVSSK